MAADILAERGDPAWARVAAEDAAYRRVAAEHTEAITAAFAEDDRPGGAT